MRQIFSRIPIGIQDKAAQSFGIVKHVVGGLTCLETVMNQLPK